MVTANNVAPSPAKWHIESIDYRAGMAFATWRTSHAEPYAGMSDRWPCLFFAPPNFSPEPVGNVALAFSAQRGSFGTGPLIEDREASFASPEDVAEFVRRSYIASAGGDGGAGGGDNQPVPPAPPDGDGLRIDVRRGDDDGSQNIRDMVQQFQRQSRQTQADAALAFSWQSKRSPRYTDAVFSGALLVLREIVARAPAHSPPSGLHDWHTTMRAYGGAVSRAGLWQGLAFGRYAGLLSQVLHPLQQLDWWPAGIDFDTLPSDDRSAALLVLFGNGFALDNWDQWRMLPYLIRHYDFMMPLGGWGSDDPMPLLRRLPLPAQFATLLDRDIAGHASLYHLLPVFFAAPQTVLPIAAATDIIDVVLFACTCVVTATAGDAHSVVASYHTGPSPQQQYATEKTAAAAAAWLRQHLPALAFAPALEAVISQAKSVRYG